jgi:hypothetical protein
MADCGELGLARREEINMRASIAVALLIMPWPAITQEKALNLWTTVARHKVPLVS